MTSFNSVAVIGAGAWGTALTGVTARAGREVVLCARSSAMADAIAATRTSPKLPGVKLDANVKVTDDIAVAAQADIILLATPAQNLRAAVTALAPHLAKDTPVIACAKGIERGTHKFMTEVIAEAAPNASPAILSGPSFAVDVARGLPTAVTLAARDAELAKHLVRALGSATFRPYHTSDVRGVEIGGAAKNVLARFGRALGARAETLVGLSGLGDLILTCASPQSRNFALGLALGRAQPRPRDKLAEGEFTAPVLMELAASQDIDMPVSNAVADILRGAKTVDDAIEGLLARPFRAEG